jgi:ubiquitin-like protein Nedd8
MGTQFELEIEPEFTILNIKELIKEKTATPDPEAYFPTIQQKLVLGGRVLSNETTASELKLTTGSELQLILALRG